MMSETTDGDETDVRDVVELRNYERRQVAEFLPDVIVQFEDTELQDRADRLTDVLDVFDEPIDEETEYDLGADVWEDMVVGLEQLDSTRASWLKAKIARRAELPAIMMGFSSEIPLMAVATMKKPTRPE